MQYGFLGSACQKGEGPLLPSGRAAFGVPPNASDDGFLAKGPGAGRQGRHAGTRALPKPPNNTEYKSTLLQDSSVPKKVKGSIFA